MWVYLAHKHLDLPTKVAKDDNPASRWWGAVGLGHALAPPSPLLVARVVAGNACDPGAEILV